MTETLHLEASPRYQAPILALIELLGKLRLDYCFVGRVAKALWLGEQVSDGAVDVLVLVTPDRSAQLPMMAGNRGFLVDRQEVEAAGELDLIPMRFPDPEAPIRIHALMASNALYSRMLAGSITAELEGVPVKIIAPEDLVVLMLVEEERREIIDSVIDRAGEKVNVTRLNEKLTSIGLSARKIVR
ncbi:MAG TPA: hypothetical protein VHL58_20215 [Thermoanaerobaculia bacterium]|nr:hypothetical protein [Thermoanaerobaculia bacterium]